MSSRVLALALLATLGCDLERETQSVLLQGEASVEVRLIGDGEDQYIDGSEASAQWIHVSSPIDGSYELRADGVDAVAVFSSQGRYVLDRWVDYQLSSVWTHRYTVDVGNSAPSAKIRAPMLGELGVPVPLDATQSFDIQGSVLQYQWFMKLRPTGSSSVLSETDSEFTQFIPDQLGDYMIGLNVFDGQAWGDTPDAVLVFVR